jgi:hypothetical protein
LRISSQTFWAIASPGFSAFFTSRAKDVEQVLSLMPDSLLSNKHFADVIEENSVNPHATTKLNTNIKTNRGMVNPRSLKHVRTVLIFPPVSLL